MADVNIENDSVIIVQIAARGGADTPAGDRCAYPPWQPEHCKRGAKYQRDYCAACILCTVID